MSPSPEREWGSREPHKWILGLFTAALIGMCGWIYTTGNRVTALETQDKSQGQILEEIHRDVREIRTWLMEK